LARQRSTTELLTLVDNVIAITFRENTQPHRFREAMRLRVFTKGDSMRVDLCAVKKAADT
jgi:hypothetical protein